MIQLAVLFAASLALLPAQQDRPPAVRGISIPAVTGLPFTATLVIAWERDSEDGYLVERRTINVIARDAQGRTRNEVRRMMPESFHGSPPLISVRLYDPQTRMRTTCDLETLAGHREFVPRTPATPARAPNPMVHTEDLGASTMNGLEVKGTRRITQVDDAYGETLQVEDESWYSPEFHLTLLARHTDPRIDAVQTIGVSGLRREEPAASLFDVPQGCKIRAVPQPAAPEQPTPLPPAKAEPGEEPPS
jgi:hypothetical protein